MALLYSIRLWSRLLTTCRTVVRARSDSVTALSVLAKLSSSSGVLNFVGAHLAIELESNGIELSPEHIFGKWNRVPDALSRKFAPDARHWSTPAVLSFVNKVANLRALDKSFWLLACPSEAPRL